MKTSKIKSNDPKKAKILPFNQLAGFPHKNKKKNQLIPNH